MSDKKKIKVFVLVAFPASNEPNYKFCEDLERLGYDAILLGTNIKSPELNSITKLIIVQIKLLFTAFKSILISNRKDIIVARLDRLAVYAIIASKLLLRKRYVIALNIMLKEQKSIRTFFKNKLYKFVMSDLHIFKLFGDLESYNSSNERKGKKVAKLFPHKCNDPKTLKH